MSTFDYASLFTELESAHASPRGIPVSGSIGQGLSDEQAAALAGSFSRSATVCAGAGAGKTRLLVERAAALVAAGANPDRVAVVTFTRKAATEISGRLATRLGTRNRVPVCATVHSLALSLLTRKGLAVRVASDAQVAEVLAQLRQELPEEYDDYSDSELLLEMNRCREEEQYHTTSGIISLRFEELLAIAGLTDFTSLLVVATKTIKGGFDHILVDEAQDLSQLQQTFLRTIGNPRSRYWYIGDADQAIYAFRGAHADVMRELTAQCDDQYVLSMNYRSANSIVQHANNVIRFNEGRIAIDWKAHRTDAGSVSVEYFDHGDKELDHVEQWLWDKPGRAVLARTQALIAPLREKGLAAFTVHESKGLEWSDVWVMGCEAALFPHPLCARDEERRLFYVAMTRARDTLTLSYCGSRSTKNPANATRHPSGFLFETQALNG